MGVREDRGLNKGDGQREDLEDFRQLQIDFG